MLCKNSDNDNDMKDTNQAECVSPYVKYTYNIVRGT